MQTPPAFPKWMETLSCLSLSSTSSLQTSANFPDPANELRLSCFSCTLHWWVMLQFVYMLHYTVSWAQCHCAVKCQGCWQDSRFLKKNELRLRDSRFTFIFGFLWQKYKESMYKTQHCNLTEGLLPSFIFFFVSLLISDHINSLDLRKVHNNHIFCPDWPQSTVPLQIQ